MISEFTLFVFTLLGGISAGAYLISALFPRKGAEDGKTWLFPLVCLVLLGVGLLCVLFHLQQPARFINALANPQSGITLEAYFSMAFGLCVLVDCVLLFTRKKGARWLEILAAVFALCLMFAMSYMYLISGNVPAWNSWETVPFYVVLDLAMGAAFYPLFAKGVEREGAYPVVSAVLHVLAAVSAALVGVHFASVGLSPVPFVVACVALVAAAVLAWRSKAASASNMAALVCVLSVVGVAIARYAYYAASIL